MGLDFKKMKKEIAKSKKKSKKKRLLKKPTAKLPSTDPKKFITQGLQKPNLVREGRTGYIKEEMIKEMKWLS